MVMEGGRLFGPAELVEPDRRARMELTLADGRVIEQPWPVSEFHPGHGLRVHITWTFPPPIPEGSIRVECEWPHAGLAAGVLEIDSSPLIAGMRAARPVWQPGIDT